MKRLIDDDTGGLVAMMGKQVTCLCMSYFYTGKLTGVNADSIELTNPVIIYETGPWTAKEWKDAQALPCKTILVMKAAIEACGEMK